MDDDDAFALRRVPLYGWAALVVVGYAIYYRQMHIAVAAVAGWAIVKMLRGRL